MEMEKIPVVIDCDTGVDDAQAIMMSLSSPRHSVVALTCVTGNTSLANVLNNTQQVLQVCQRTDIPIYVGCSLPLVASEEIHASASHDDDGLGGVAQQLTSFPSVQPREIHASRFLVDLVKRRPKEILLVALAPLTNLSVAQRLDPNFSSNLKELVIMGGTRDGIGNMTTTAEFNFFKDPEAARCVLKEFTCPKTLVPWETCLDTPLEWNFMDQLRAVDTPKGRFHAEMTSHVYHRQKKKKLRGFASADAAAMCVALDERRRSATFNSIAVPSPPSTHDDTSSHLTLNSALDQSEATCHTPQPPVDSAILKSKAFVASVELNGSLTRGMTVIEKRSWVEEKKGETKIKIVEEINKEELKKRLLEMVQ